MKLRFACRACGATVRTGEISPPISVQCPECGSQAEFSAPPSPGGLLDRCLACGGRHLFIQKEFPRRLGLAIVVLGAGAFLVFMGFERLVLGFGALAAVALLDIAIYRTAPLMTVCYRCSTEYRRAPVNPEHAGYDPKVAFYTAKQAEAARAEGAAAHEAPATTGPARNGARGDRARTAGR